MFLLLDGVNNLKPKIKKSPGKSAVWVTKNRFVCLDSRNSLILKNLENQNVNFGGFSSGFLLPKSDQEVTKTPVCDKIFPGDRDGTVLLWNSDTKVLTKYNMLKKKRVCSTTLPAGCKEVVWSGGGDWLAVIGKQEIRILSKAKFKCLASQKTRHKIKSGAWCTTSGRKTF